MPTDVSKSNKVAEMQGEIDTLQEKVAALKKTNENLVAEVNRLTTNLKDATVKMTAYQIVMSDIIKRG